MSQSTVRPAPARSPILAAVGLSLAIAAGSIVSTIDMQQVEDFATGQWFTRPLAEAQQRHTLAIAHLQNTVSAITKDIDFVAGRVSSSMRHNEERTSDRLAYLDAEIAELKDKIAGIQQTRAAPARAPEPQREANADVIGLRLSLTELADAHGSAIAAITKRLQRIEVSVGLTTDMVSSVSNPSRRAEVAKQAKQAKKQTALRPAAPSQAAPPPAAPANDAAPATVARPDRGHIFNIKPISEQGAPLKTEPTRLLRLSRLPG
jgi:hypothetical protein